MEQEISNNYSLLYRTAHILLNTIGLPCFNPKIYGKENIPKESSILVANHATSLDGILVSMFTKKQIHFWIQYENVYEKNPKLLESIGEIPVKVKELDIKFWKNITLKRSLFYLKNTNDFIGIFPEGPMEKLNKNKTYRGAINLACEYEKIHKNRKKIVPVGLWVPEKYNEKINKYTSGFDSKKVINVLKENTFRRIPYYAFFGEGIEVKSCNSKEQKKLAKDIFERCERLVDKLK